MAIDPAAREDLVLFSQGVPYIAHLLCIHTCRAALASGRKTIYASHVEQGMNRSLDQWQQSIKTRYDEAIQSPRPGHIYREVLLACALAEVDDLRFFTTGAVKRPLARITNKDFEPFNYARHLKDLSEPSRGRILQRVGESFRMRYRISNPILRPYIIMRGVKDKLIAKDQILHRKDAADERLRRLVGPLSRRISRIDRAHFGRARAVEASLPLHQRRHMRGDRARQPLEIVAAFQHRDDAVAAGSARNLHQPPRRPAVVGLDQIEVAERIAVVGVEAGRDDDEIGRERLDARQDHGLHRLAKGFAPVARPQRRVDDLVVLAALADRAGARDNAASDGSRRR